MKAIIKEVVSGLFIAALFFGAVHTLFTALDEKAQCQQQITKLLIDRG